MSESNVFDAPLEGLPWIYVARMECDIDYRPTFMSWYKTKHAPDLIQSGFYSCTSYACEVGAPWDLNIYEISGPDIFRSTKYQTARTPEHDPQRPEVLSHVSDRSNTPYVQLLVDPSPDAADGMAGDQRGAVDAPGVSAVFFDCGPGGDAERLLRGWVEGSELALNRAAAGYRRLRLCRRQGSHVNVSTQPEWLLLVEWDSTVAARAAGAEQAGERLRAALAGAATRVAVNVAARTHAVRARPFAS